VTPRAGTIACVQSGQYSLTVRVDAGGFCRWSSGSMLRGATAPCHASTMTSGRCC